jgi:adenosylcobinamide-GDP ribazoletransferase
VALVRAAAGALAFLTIVPLGRLGLGERDVARGVVVFPLVGALVGAGVALVGLALDDVLTAFLAAVVAVAFEAVATGGIHLDGLVDTADGLGVRTRERALAVMREGSIGAFGASALALDLLLKTGAVAALLADEDALLVLASAFALGRAAPLAVAWSLPYARPAEGSGRILTELSPRFLLGGGLVLAGGLAGALAGFLALALVGGALAATLVVAAVARWRLGGTTGDVLGASIELATTGSLLAAVAAA